MKGRFFPHIPQNNFQKNYNKYSKLPVILYPSPVSLSHYNIHVRVIPKLILQASGWHVLPLVC